MCEPLNRKGRVCSECKDGYGLSVMSVGYRIQCSNCTSAWYGVPLYLILEFYNYLIIDEKVQESGNIPEVQSCQKQVTALIRLYKSKFFRLLRPSDPSKSVKLLNKQDCSVSTLVHKGSTVESSCGKANLLNKYFRGCFNTYAPTLTPQAPFLILPVSLRTTCVHKVRFLT